MKRLVVFTGSLMVLGVSLLRADVLLIPEASTATVLSSGTVQSEPFFWPVSAKIGSRKTRVVSKFGMRKPPPQVSSATVVGGPAQELHEGIDFALPAESNVRASRPGKVLFAGYSSAYVSRADKKDKNHLVIIRHDDGKSTRYVHLERLRVRPGVVVKAGDIVGTSSGSDEWTEPVVHFEIREANGQALDPLKWLQDPELVVLP